MNLLYFDCTHCGATSGQKCRTGGGAPTEPHRNRYNRTPRTITRARRRAAAKHRQDVGAARRGTFGLRPAARAKAPGHGRRVKAAKPVRYACGQGHQTKAYNGGQCSDCGRSCWLVMSEAPDA